MSGLLEKVERIGNKLPDPTTLFVVATLLVILLSHVAAMSGWQVTKPGSDEVIVAKSLLANDGLWWLLSNLVENFIGFAPLGIVLVGMLGIGLAERSGFIDALLSRAARRMSQRWLTPGFLFLGILSSMGLDAGYVVLPPIAASVYLALGRSPLVGIAVAFAGISAGFSANISITAIDTLLAGFTETGAQFLDADYRVAVTANLWLMIVSTFYLIGIGWLVTEFVVAPKADAQWLAAHGVPESQNAEENGDNALRLALLAIGIFFAVVLALVLTPGALLHGDGDRFARWVEATVPLIFIGFMVPALVYGFASGRFKSDKDVAKAFGEVMSSLGPYIVLAFFAAQFIAGFKYCHLGEMLAISGGETLRAAALPNWTLILGFIFMVMIGNLLIGSASAKYAFFAPVFVPMFMQVGIAPELTQAAYRIGDSVTNIITPLNPYMIIIVAFVQKYARDAGIGSIIALMLPYALAFGIAWPLLLLGWLALGVPLGPGGELTYSP